MKVYVYTQAELFSPEIYLGVKGSKKEAEKVLRNMFPHMKPDLNNQMSGTNKKYSYVSDAQNTLLLFIHEEEV